MPLRATKCPLWVMCGRRLGKNFLTLRSIGRVRSCVRPVDAARLAAGPNALRGSGPNRSHAFEDALTQAGSPDPRNDRVCITSLCPRQFLRFCQLRCRQQLRLLELLAAHHHGPRHSCDSVSKCNRSDFDRPTIHQAHQPEPLRAVLARIADDGHRTGDEQPAQMSIALL